MDPIQPPKTHSAKRPATQTQTQTVDEIVFDHACKIRVPASTGNLGPGFDTLGLALNLYNYFELNINVNKTTIHLASGSTGQLKAKCYEMVEEAANYFFKKCALPKRHYYLTIHNQIPIARGLASSATVRLAILCGLDHLLKTAIHTSTLVQWAAELEGCTDNVTSCFFGGFTASGIIEDRLHWYRFDVSNEIDFVAVSPTNTVETKSARTVFTDFLPRHDAILTLNRGIMLASAFARNDYEGMTHFFEDKFHQPQRQAGIPALKPLFEVIQAAKKAGAIGAFLSGSGSTIMAMTLHDKEAVAQNMKDVMMFHDIQAEARFLKADNDGLIIEA